MHVSSARLGRAVPAWEQGLLGDKAHSLVFDNAKVKALVPDFTATTTWAEGAREVVAFHDAHPELQVVDHELDATLDRLVEAERG